MVPTIYLQKVFYSDNLATSEQLARKFFDEAVVGFDMEWIWPETDVLKERAARIQVASESEIALFHIGRHDGETVNQFIAPSLRTLIEDLLYSRQAKLSWEISIASTNTSNYNPGALSS
jgi:hypothetical protein